MTMHDEQMPIRIKDEMPTIKKEAPQMGSAGGPKTGEVPSAIPSVPSPAHYD